MLHTLRLARNKVGVMVAVVAALGVGLTYVLAPLNANLRYEAGVKIAGTDTASGTFSHRPLAYRLVMDAVFRTADALSVGVVSFELVVRLLLALAAVGAGVVLRRGLAQQQVRHPGLHAVVVVGGLVMLGPISAGEPDWMAALLAASGAGVALLNEQHRWLWGVLAGVLFVAAAGMKIVTLPIAVIALVVVLMLDHRKGGRALAGTVAVGVLYVVATLLWVPWEVQWLLDIRAVQNSAVDGLPEARPFFLSLVADQQVLALVPAALVLACTKERAVIAGSVIVTAGSVVAQGQYFSYHAIPLVIVSSVAVFRALIGRVTALVGVAILAVVAAASALSTTSPGWQNAHQQFWATGLALFAVTGVTLAFLVRGRETSHHQTAAVVAAFATLALLFAGTTPWSAQLLRPENPDGKRPATTLQTRDTRTVVATRVHKLIGGPGVTVTYLTSGEWTYWIANPTNCRYPSPLFLQRTRKEARLGTASYRENRACLTDPDAHWLIIETSWFIASRQPASVKVILEQEWNCGDAAKVDGLRLCPRRL